MKTSSNNGFSLVELMVVVLVIAVLSGMVLGGVGYLHKKAIDARCEAQFALVQLAIEAYKSDHGFYPGVSSAGPAPPPGSPVAAVIAWQNNGLKARGSCALSRALVEGQNDYRTSLTAAGKVYISGSVITRSGQAQFQLNPNGQVLQNGGAMAGAYKLLNPNRSEYYYMLGSDLPSTANGNHTPVNRGTYDLWVYTSIPGKSYRNWKDRYN
jgi:prepilin-type N-terminal cleavage/methylation domain-containing protein